MPMIVLALATSTIRVEGTAICPAPAQVASRLEAKPIEFNARLSVTQLADAVHLTLFGADGQLLAERRLDAGPTCSELAETAAVVVWSWTLTIPASTPRRTEPPTPKDPGPTLKRSVAPLDTSTTSKPRPQHAVFLEVGGVGIHGSVNYEYRPLALLAVRAGISPLCLLTNCTPAVLFVVGASVLLLDDPHHIELGLNASTGVTDGRDARFLSPSLGYRFEEIGGGFVVRLSYSPLLRAGRLGNVWAWASLSTGYSW